MDIDVHIVCTCEFIERVGNLRFHTPFSQALSSLPYAQYILSVQ